jgi:hypothetical protein
MFGDVRARLASWQDGSQAPSRERGGAIFESEAAIPAVLHLLVTFGSSTGFISPVDGGWYCMIAWANSKAFSRQDAPLHSPATESNILLVLPYIGPLKSDCLGNTLDLGNIKVRVAS